MPYNLFHLASAILNWTLWDSWVAELLTRRRDYQGLPLREGEIEQMQALWPEIFIVGGTILIVLLLIAIPRLRSRHQSP